MRITFRSHISILLVYLVRCEEVRCRALDRLEPQDIADVIPNENGIAYGAVWREIRDYQSRYKKFIPQIDLEARLSGNDEIAAMEDRDKLFATIDNVYQQDPSLCEVDEGLRILSEVLRQVHVTDKVQSALNSGASSEELKLIIDRGSNASSFAKPNNTIPVADADTVFAALVHSVPMGDKDAYFNKLTDGGPGIGELGLLAGPTGGFKTAVAVDILCGMAEKEQYSLFLSYKQGVGDGDLQSRFLCRLLRVSRDCLEKDKDFIAQNGTEILSPLKDAGLTGEYIRWLDRRNAVDKVADIDAQIAELVRLRTRPELVIIDEFKTCVSRWSEYIGSGIQNRLEIMRMAMDALKRVAEKHQTRILVLHQLAFTKGVYQSSYTPDITDFDGYAHVVQGLDFVIMLSRQCARTGSLRAVTTKLRRGKLSSLILKPNAPFCGLEEASEYKKNDFDESIKMREIDL